MNQDLQTYIDIYHKESERCAAYLEQSNAHFNNIANINVNSDGITPQKNRIGKRNIVRNIIRKIVIYLLTKVRKIVVKLRMKQLNQTLMKKLNQTQAIKLNKL